MVRDGQLEELKEMLMLGEVSLRDHDEFGASLLLSKRRGFWPEARTIRKKSLETTRTIDLL